MSRPTEPLAFMMGEYEARFPTHLLYASNHMWAFPVTEDRLRFGLTGYAVRLLQDVYFLDWIVDPPASITDRQEIGAIESKKAESDLYAPLAGELTEINAEALDDPSVINVSPYEDGWLFELSIRKEAAAKLMTPAQYLIHLESAWKVAQRTIKGQVNTD